MRSPRTVHLVLCSATIVLSAACNKGPGFGPLNEDASSLAATLESNVENARQYFQVDAVAGGPITGVQGVHVVFGPNAFRNAAGAVVSGQVDVSLVEVMDIGDMVWLNKQTVGRDGQTGMLRMLKSGGALQVLASQGGEALTLGPQGMQVNVPTDNVDPEMAVFIADSMVEDRIVWDPADSVDLDTATGQWQGSWTTYYQFQATSLNWINCDYFGGYPSTTNITAVPPSDVDPDSTLVWIGFPTENAVMGLWQQTPGSYVTWQVVPVGMPAIVIGLTRDGGNYRSAFMPITISAGLSVGLDFQPTTLQAFETALDNL